IALFIGVGIFFNFIMLASSFAIVKFTLMIISLAAVISIILLIGTQRFLYAVILTTYKICQKYEKHTGYRIINSKNLLFQMVPFICVILIIISLIGYSKAVQQEGFATANYYRAYINAKEIQPSEVNMESLKEILESIPLEDKSHYYFIITPNDEEIYVSNQDGYISDFVLKYRDYFYEKSNGVLYEDFGIDEQLYTYDIKD